MMDVARRQVIVQLDDGILGALDEAAKQKALSRSELIRRASRFYLDALEEKELQRRYAEGYRQIPPGTEWDDRYAKMTGSGQDEEG
jgi:metal-responsive CopG/Arc/MetJ family transcriptional regulator